jgi:hypothetical protein
MMWASRHSITPAPNWGRVGQFAKELAQEQLPHVTMNFGDWMDGIP